MQASFSLVTRWFNKLEHQGQPFPSNFDFGFYFKGLKIALEMTDHSLVTTKVFWHIYMTLHFFPLEHRVAIINELASKHYHRFFFHWSHNLRGLFYTVLFY